MIRVPNIGDCKVHESTRDYGRVFGVALAYQAPNGPLFRHFAETDVGRWLPSESLRMRRETARDALSNLRKLVQAHLDVVLPVDNGPADRVALAEATARLEGACEDLRIDVASTRADVLAASRYFWACAHSLSPESP
ncbi:hypothetical protein H4CHR_04389 [Variovorax sp. PBS-H4]|uniref:hypothetical protein n=1 Tax=Variovorax sp. PBS-H4 TaxID=434008 RepID=UPI0013197856|nr:hypothetical protein [Variovorax sp. PBS-H4]VTU38301.1 hypothetical protein H4CHR_04389 [Variovorax sp. PBS-H4]